MATVEEKNLTRKQYIQFLGDVLAEQRSLGIWTRYTESELTKIQDEYNNLLNKSK
jgi:hypothetical protein